MYEEDDELDRSIYNDMEKWELYYAGINSSQMGFVVGHYSKPITPTMNSSSVNIPGRFGDLYLGTDYSSKTFNIPITIIADSAEEYYGYLKNISTVLINPFEDPGTVYPLVFGDDPDKAEYYGHFESVPDPTFVSENDWVATTTLTFVAHDPKGYLPEVVVPITDSEMSVNVQGNSEVFPIFNVKTNKPLTHFGYVYNGEYVAVGFDPSYDTDSSTYNLNKEPLVIHDGASTQADWIIGSPSWKVENGVHSGSVRDTQDSSITVNYKDSKNKDNGHRDWGTGTAWHGPVMTHTAVTNPTNDWQVEYRFHFTKFYSRSMGKIEFYFIDTNGERRGRMVLKDRSGGRMPGFFAEFGRDTKKRHYLLGTESNPFLGPKKNRKNGANKVVYLYDKKKKTTTVKKKGSKKTTKKTTMVNSKKHTLEDYNNTDIFNDFFGSFRVRKVGKSVSWVLTQFNDRVQPVVELAKGSWTMSEADKNSYDFALGSMGVFMAKYDITEDKLTTDGKPTPKLYHEHWLSVTDLKIWNIIDGGNGSPNDPQYILQPGEDLQIDTETKHVYKNGISFDSHVAMGSTFPTWGTDRNNGSNNVDFGVDPGPSTDIDMNVVYRPTVQ